MKSLVGNKETSSPVILDACTIINLLRIDDEDDEFLYKHLTALNLHIAEKVCAEVRANFSKNTISEAQAKYIDSCLGTIYTDSTYHSNKDIVNDVSKEVFGKIKTFSNNHYNKDNGELYSTALGLIVSRTENKQVFFYTDDKPATDYFMSYFKHQQIGTIMDTVDLLIYLYWSNSDFDEKRLNKYLQGIYSDLNQPLNTLISKIQTIRDEFNNNELRDKTLRNNVDLMIDGYNKLNIQQVTTSAKILKDKKPNAKVTKAIENYGFQKIENDSPLIKKIKQFREDMKRTDIFKIS